MRRTLNPFAPDCLNGLLSATPPGYQDVYHEYVLNVVLTANQVRNDVTRSVDTDSDFLWWGLVFGVTDPAQVFSIRFADSQGFYLSEKRMFRRCLLGDGARPYVIWPALVYPAGSKLRIDIAELGGNPETVEIIFKGIQRFKR